MKIAALVSGGVDSSVALSLLKKAGHDVTAFYLKIWLEDELQYLGNCPWEEDLAFVQQTCEELNVPLEVLNLQQAYFDRVVNYTIHEVKAGRTPNPDMLCNARIKFGIFYEQIDQSFDKVATGHYAQVKEQNGLAHLLRSKDKVKDQTYFLSQLSQIQLKRALFPIGGMTKAKVRQYAQEQRLPAATRKDSQGICFLGKIPYDDFIQHYLGDLPGEIIEAETEKVLGEHRGFYYFTIGQRHGLYLSGGPWYVIAKEPERNRILVSRVYEKEQRAITSFTVADMNWITPHQPQQKLMVKLRHGPVEQACRISPIEINNIYRVELEQGDPGIAPGQFAVFYQGSECRGGGVISTS